MPFRPRPIALSAFFAILFAVIANLAWATAITTAGPWYDASVSIAVYAIGCILPAGLAVVLVTSASKRSSSLQASLHRVDRRVALLRANLRPGEGRASPPSREGVADDDLDAIVGGLSERGPSTLVRLEREGHDTLVPMLATASTPRGVATTEVLRQLVGERIALREALARVWMTAIGPMAACLLFLTIAGPMLPGSGGFAAAHYQLNTTLVLFLSYGLAPLVAWTVVSLGAMGLPPHRTAE